MFLFLQEWPKELNKNILRGDVACYRERAKSFRGNRIAQHKAAQTISDRICRYLPKSDVVLKLGVNSQKKLSTAARLWALFFATAFSRNRAGCTVITWANPRVSVNDQVQQNVLFARWKGKRANQSKAKDLVFSGIAQGLQVVPILQHRSHVVVMQASLPQHVHAQLPCCRVL